MVIERNHELEVIKNLGKRLLNIIVFFILCSSSIVHADDHGDSMATATSVGTNSSTAGELEESGDLDVFRVVLSQPGDLRVSTNGDTDTVGSLLGSSGELLEFDDDDGSDRNFLIERTLSAGTYFISVKGYDASTTGAYTFNVTFLATVGGDDDHGDSMATATSVGTNSSTPGELEESGDLDVFRVVLSQPGDLRVSTNGDTDTVGSLLGSSGELLEFDDDDGSDRNFLIERTLSAGTYFISVEGYDASTGAYTLIVTTGGGDDNGPFKINAGLNDAWYNPMTDGQGFFITVFPDLAKVSLAWFTYDTELPPMDAKANLGDPGHRWMTALGPFADNQAVLNIKVASGGIFDTASEIERTDDGTIILTFEDCNSGTVEYDISSIDQQGTIPIQRIAGDNIVICEALNAD